MPDEMTFDEKEAVAAAAAVDRPKAPPRSDTGGLSTAMRRADQQAEPIAAVEKALNNTAQAKPMFTTHTTRLEALLAAEEMAIREHLADVDDAIAKLNAERDNAMLAFSMVTAARTAKQKALA